MTSTVTSRVPAAAEAARHVPSAVTEEVAVELGPADHRDRVAATGVDLLLVLLASSTTFVVTTGVDGTLRFGLLLVAVGLPTFVPEGLVGRTLGKLGTQLRHTRDDELRLSLPRAAGRYVLKWAVPTVLVLAGLWLAAIVWWVGLYLPALGPTRRTLLDRLTGTHVLGPTDERGGTWRATDY